MTLAVDDMAAGEAATLLAINNAAVPAVNDLTPAEFDALAAAGAVRVARLPDGRTAGFVLTLPADARYDSLNYQWFQARFPDFFYIDRVVVAPEARGQGAGRALYADTFARALAGGHPRVCSEVNVDPPNPESMAFHARMGFVALGERHNEVSGKTVAMMVCDLG